MESRHRGAFVLLVLVLVQVYGVGVFERLQLGYETC